MLPGTAPFEIELYLDEDYNKTIASLVKKLPMGERRILEPLFRKELLLQNLLWALRLRWYYGYSEEQTHKLLFAFSYTDIEKTRRPILQIFPGQSGSMAELEICLGFREFEGRQDQPP